jgi:Muconolactone delta-isomerase
MQYLVEGARGPLPPSPEQAIALLEQTVIPHFEYVIRLKSEGKILACGLPVGDRAFVFIIEAPSNDEADRIVRDMPAWGLLEWKVTPLQSVEARAEMERKVVQALRSARRPACLLSRSDGRFGGEAGGIARCICRANGLASSSALGGTGWNYPHRPDTPISAAQWNSPWVSRARVNSGYKRLRPPSVLA